MPRGPLSLSPEDSRFHPRHIDDAHHHKDAAYHKGTAWAWTAGPAITALTRFGQQDIAYVVSRELARQMLEGAAPGHLAELTEATLGADDRVRPSGTYAQSWSSAEFVRNAVLPLGQRESLRLRVTQHEGRQLWTFAARKTPLRLSLGGTLRPGLIVLHRGTKVFDVPIGPKPTPWTLAAEPAPPPEGWPVLQGRDVLEHFIESGGLDRHPQPIGL